MDAAQQKWSKISQQDIAALTNRYFFAILENGNKKRFVFIERSLFELSFYECFV